MSMFNTKFFYVEAKLGGIHKHPGEDLDLYTKRFLSTHNKASGLLRPSGRKGDC